jgi:hypothetical protein
VAVGGGPLPVTGGVRHSSSIGIGTWGVPNWINLRFANAREMMSISGGKSTTFCLSQSRRGGNDESKRCELWSKSREAELWPGISRRFGKGMSPESRARSPALADKHRAEMPLDELRQAREMAQMHRARILKVKQGLGWNVAPICMRALSKIS